VKGYWEASRAPRYSLLFVLPLVISYEMLAAVLTRDGSSVRNGAEVLLRWLFQELLGANGPLLLGVVLTIACGYLFVRDLRTSGGNLRASVLAGMLLEAAILAAVFGLFVASVTSQLLRPFAALALAQLPALSTAENVLVSLGAGVYEELLFRVILVSLLTLFFRHALKLSLRASSLWAVLLGATVFSLFHYIGPFGDPFQLPSFLFRLVAGVFFSGLYVLRGFGITAWTHALYDLYLLT
jgi:membrane protease YdiL (CAAX protease family)